MGAEDTHSALHERHIDIYAEEMTTLLPKEAANEQLVGLQPQWLATIQSLIQYTARTQSPADN